MCELFTIYSVDEQRGQFTNHYQKCLTHLQHLALSAYAINKATAARLVKEKGLYGCA